MKYIINDKVYTCNTKNPHDDLREILIEAMLRGDKIEKVED